MNRNLKVRKEFLPVDRFDQVTLGFCQNTRRIVSSSAWAVMKMVGVPVAAP